MNSTKKPNKISILSDSLKNMIAAGEVIEGPFSVVKELVENSIDAGADEITVEVEESGMKKITVRDNGCGILKDDLALSIAEHATSKIRELSDIENISSFGFRGEALSSIASVSKLTLLSRTTEESIGGKIISTGEDISVHEYAGPTGTTVVVENLFFTTPARKKFLKSLPMEMKSIRETIIRLAVPHPEISFSLSHNGKKIITTTKVSSFSERISQIFGNDEMDTLSHGSINDLKISIEGYMSKPNNMRPSSSMQFFYVNGRPIESRNLRYQLSRAYEGIAIKGQYPAAFVFIKIEPTLVDVNIHPAKREVKMFDQRYVENLLHGLAKKILGENSFEIPISLTKNISTENENHHINGLNLQKNIFDDDPVYFKNNEKTFYNSTKDDFSLLKEGKSDFKRLSQSESINVLGTIFGTYILVEKDDTLFTIDFHAACERFVYDELISKNRHVETEEKIFPETISMSQADIINIIEIRELLLEFGLNFDLFSEDTIVINSVPTILSKTDMKTFFRDIASMRDPKDTLDDIAKKAAERIACHSAKRANDHLSREEIEHITKKVFSGEHELRCPHGRPFVMHLRKIDFEMLFKR